jgi:hypothetical protein
MSDKLKSILDRKNIFQTNLDDVIDSLTEEDGYFGSIFKKMTLTNMQNAKILCDFVTPRIS